MQIPDTSEAWTASLNEVIIGATSADGGTRTATVTVGGGRCIPGAAYEGKGGLPPAIAVEVWDVAPDNWPEELTRHYGDALNDPAAWAAKGVEFGADLICLRLAGTHPDAADRSGEDAAATLKAVLQAVGVPLVVWGNGVAEKDNEVLPRCTGAAAGENCLFGSITEKNYRTLVAACLADKHKLISESPLDINIAKQVNILAQDAGFSLADIVMFPTTGALGYGFEYVYSIMERGRLAGLTGDQLLRQPVLCDVGAEAWRVKEARSEDEELEKIGPVARRGPLWEALTATNLLMAGGDVFVMRHPEAIKVLRQAIGMISGGDSEQAS
ncbi:MAG: acetyl-CoA decarbonylase/synthase complex subunit delta [Planctomycetota bacterium]|jgi:acetyl-CoA decarbonylase/synthase complex subunit delta